MLIMAHTAAVALNYSEPTQECLMQETSPSIDSATTAFVGVRLIDGTGRPPVPDAVVLVQGTCIVQAGSAQNMRIPPTARIVPIEGRTIMPGLIDAHVHAGNVCFSMADTAALPPAVYVHRATRILETDLQLGFTTLRDAAGLDSSFRDAINQGLIKGPRLFLSINPLTPTGGHFDMRTAWEEIPHRRNSLGIYPAICDGPVAVRKATREALRRGADQIKVAADGGVDSPTDQPGHWQFTIEELKAAVEVAQACGKYVMAHVYGAQAVRHCLAAGVRSIEHGNLLDRETADLMAEKGAFYVPTLSILDLVMNDLKGTVSPQFMEKAKAVAEPAMQAVELASRAGVQIGSGSDILGPYQHLKGRELALKAQVLSPMEAIVSATRINAQILGEAERIGTLEAGKQADLIVVEGDPLNDPRLFEAALEKVVLVMKAGQVMKNHLPAHDRKNGPAPAAG
jgi:imidazolonepropionase-like amidohydrolase